MHFCCTRDSRAGSTTVSEFVEKLPREGLGPSKDELDVRIERAHHPQATLPCDLLLWNSSASKQRNFCFVRHGRTEDLPPTKWVWTLTNPPILKKPREYANVCETLKEQQIPSSLAKVKYTDKQRFTTRQWKPISTCPVEATLWRSFNHQRQLVYRTVSGSGRDSKNSRRGPEISTVHRRPTISCPTQALPKIMEMLSEFLGIQVNVNKTQVLTLNYDPPIEIKNRCKWKWDTGSIRYVGVVIHRDVTKTFDANYGAVNESIKSDIQRWNTIPLLDLHSRVEAIRLNMLYLFRSLQIPTPQKQFVEWDRLLSKYIWKGNKARVKYKTLYNISLWEYYCAAQLRPLICLCCLDYTVGWKDLEGTNVKVIPATALISDTKLQNKTNLPDEPTSNDICLEWSNKNLWFGNASKVFR